jgi:hypothetical protein
VNTECIKIKGKIGAKSFLLDLEQRTNSTILFPSFLLTSEIIIKLETGPTGFFGELVRVFFEFEIEQTRSNLFPNPKDNKIFTAAPCDMRPQSIIGLKTNKKSEKSIESDYLKKLKKNR